MHCFSHCRWCYYLQRSDTTNHRRIGAPDMYTDDNATPGEPRESDASQSQEGGSLTGMLKGTVSGVGDSLRSLVRSEVELAKAELKQEATQVGKAGGMI